MNSRDYILSFGTDAARAKKLVAMLHKDGIRAFHIPDGPKRLWEDVYVEAAEVERAASIFDRKDKDPDTARLLRERRRRMEVPWGFEQMVLPERRWRND